MKQTRECTRGKNAVVSVTESQLFELLGRLYAENRAQAAQIAEQAKAAVEAREAAQIASKTPKLPRG